jgi:hypothetical protein
MTSPPSSLSGALSLPDTPSDHNDCVLSPRTDMQIDATIDAVLTRTNALKQQPVAMEMKRQPAPMPVYQQAYAHPPDANNYQRYHPAPYPAQTNQQQYGYGYVQAPPQQQHHYHQPQQQYQQQHQQYFTQPSGYAPQQAYAQQQYYEQQQYHYQAQHSERPMYNVSECTHNNMNYCL